MVKMKINFRHVLGLMKQVFLSRGENVIAKIIVGLAVSILSGVLVFMITNRLKSKREINITASEALKIFPIHEGNRWTYNGFIEADDPDNPHKHIKREFDNYTISIQKVIEYPNQVIALVRKSYEPIDLINGITTPRFELWVLTGGKFFIIQDQKEVEKYRQSSPPKDIFIPTEYLSLEWEFPMFVGQKYDVDTIRSDNMYSYVVTKKSKIKLTGSAGSWECYKRVLETCPDKSYAWFCPGLGVVEYQYIHHGAVMNEHFRLKSYFIKT